MMWKENYRLGSELLDHQHMELFRIAEKLLEVIQRGSPGTKKKECIDTIVFLKNYAIEHFSAEEAFQRSLDYPGYAEHVRLHQSFTTTVLDMEKKLAATEFDLQMVKQFAGFLSAWLIYHVADADQKITKIVPPDFHESKPEDSFNDFLAGSIRNVLNTMTGSKDSKVSHCTEFPAEESVVIRSSFTGDFQGTIYFSFPKQTALSLVNTMISSDLDETDEMVSSALLQFCRIAGDKAAALLSSYSRQCQIAPPALEASRPVSGSGFLMNTEYGRILVIVKNQADDPDASC